MKTYSNLMGSVSVVGASVLCIFLILCCYWSDYGIKVRQEVDADFQRKQDAIQKQREYDELPDSVKLEMYERDQFYKEVKYYKKLLEQRQR